MTSNKNLPKKKRHLEKEKLIEKLEETGEEEEIREKVKKAAAALLFQSHNLPGLKGWELRRILGRKYLEIIDLLDHYFNQLGLKVRIVPEKSEKETDGKINFERARFYVTIKDPLPLSYVKGSGWRIDDLAILSASIAYVTAKQGKVPRKELEKILLEKFPKWKVEYNLNRFIKMGYLEEDENLVLRLGWRSKVEVNKETLLNLMVGAEEK